MEKKKKAKTQKESVSNLEFHVKHTLDFSNGIRYSNQIPIPTRSDNPVLCRCASAALHSTANGS